MSHKLRVGVVRGGPSDEYEISLQTGANVLRSLSDYHEGKYHAHDILIDQDGNWHFDGVPVTIDRLCNRIDVAFNALHGTFGEDGKVQHIFESHNLPFTGSGSLASAVGMNKVLSKKVFLDHEIQTPNYRLVNAEDIAYRLSDLHDDFYRSIILPAVVKPLKNGSSVGISIVRNYDEFPAALLKAVHYDDEILIEDYIRGIEATCGVIDSFRGEDIYALPPIEIVPDSEFFDYAAKYLGKSREIVPATFSHRLKEMIQELSRKIHRALGLRHYSRSDFIIHPKRGIYALEVNTLPGLSGESLMPKALRAVGSDTHYFVDHIIELAHRKR